MTDKSDLRQEALRHRDRIDPASEPTEEIVRLFFDTVRPEPDQIVAAYWPKGREFPTFDLLAELMAHGIACALPVMVPGSRILSFLLWRDGEPLAEGPFGIHQPIVGPATQTVLPDIVLTPLLAFDRRGHRLGHGMGYYDATLADLRARKPVQAVGLAWAQQAVLFNLPTDPHDQPLDIVLTPFKAHCFRT